MKPSIRLSLVSLVSLFGLSFVAPFVALFVPSSLHAQTLIDPATATSTASGPTPEAEATADAPKAPPATPSTWDRVLGLTTSYRPRYPGAARRGIKTDPGFYLRYGRFTVTNAGGFAPRRNEAVPRGLGVDVLRGEKLSASLSLRYDAGRSEHGSVAYAGLGNIPKTLRARMAVSWDFKGPWRLGAAWNADVMGRGNGGVGDISGGWEKHLDDQTTLSLSSSLSVGDAHYMQAYYGITPKQSARSVYPAYQARAGWRDAGVGLGLRHDMARDWVAVGGLNATRLLGAAASSPITRSRNGWGLSGGLGWRF